VIDRILTRPGLVLALAALVTLGLGYAATRIGFDNTPEQWLPSGGTGLEELERFRERFGEDSLILAFTRQARLQDDGWRADFAALAERLRALDGMGSVLVPGDALPPGGEAPAAAFPNPLEPYLVGPDGQHVALALFLEDGLTPQERSRFVTEIESVLAEAEPRLGDLDVAGADVITHDLDAGTARSLGGLAPAVLLLMVAIFAYATHSARAVGAMMVAAVLSAVWAVGVMALAGRTLNLVIVVMPAILAVLTAAHATHLLSRFLAIHARPEDGADPAARRRWWHQAIADTWRPCLLSAVTTAAGFAALGTSEIPPIRDMGIFTAIGVFFSCGLTFTVIPALLVRSRRVVPHPVESRRWTPARSQAATAFLRRHAAAVLVVALALTALGAFGVSRLQLESHILSFFPAEHRVPTNYRELEDTLVGLTPFELIVQGPRGQVLSAETLGALESFLDDALSEEPLLLQAMSPFVGAHAPDVPPAVRASYLDATLPASPALLPDAARKYVWLDDAGDTLALRTTLTSQTSSSNACDALVRRLRARLDGAFPDSVEAVITGGPTLLIRGQVLLLDTQIRSFALAFGVVTLVIALAFRSGAILGISLLPNLLPVVLTLGLMGLLAIPLNTATVTVAGIALGLIVDDTIHFLHRYADARRHGAPRPRAVADSLYLAGRPILVTSLAVAAGFGAFALSPFPPTLYFGLLIAWTSVSAVVCDLVVLPALLVVGGEAGPYSAGSGTPCP